MLNPLDHRGGPEGVNIFNHLDADAGESLAFPTHHGRLAGEPAMNSWMQIWRISRQSGLKIESGKSRARSARTRRGQVIGS